MSTLKTTAPRLRAAYSALAAAAFAFAFVAGCASTQPHMQSALDHLNAARGELEQAASNKGGHRERAIEFVNQAIAQVEEGMSFARRR
jgi:outer membrane murein-binding lipoprotein Lpp